MRFLRVPLVLVLPLLAGCGYVHFGRQTAPAPTTGSRGMDEAYSNLVTEHKILKQELALARKEGDALRGALERGPGAQSSPELVAQLTETTRELATLRSNYAKLQGDLRSGAPAAAGTQSQVAELEEKLAASLRNYTRLQEENAKLRQEVSIARAENTTLTEQVKSMSAQSEQARDAIAQLNTELLAQKDARSRAEQVSAAVRAQLDAVMAARPPDAPPSTAGPADAAGSTSPLQLAKSASVETAATAELRTSADRVLTPGSASATAPSRRVHVVEVGETLESIAQKYYGSPDRWSKVYAANNDLLRNGRPLTAGMQLEIPEN